MYILCDITCLLFTVVVWDQTSHIMRKTFFFCICENKGANQLRDNPAADQCLCFRYIDSTVSFLPRSEISSLYPSSAAVKPGLCPIWTETPKTGFLMTWLKHGFKTFPKS